MHSLRARLFVVWALSLAAALAVGVLLLQLQGQSASARQARAEAIAQQTCERIGERYGYYTADWSAPAATTTRLDQATRRDLRAVLALALAPDPAVQAGLWHPGDATVASLPPASLLSPAERAATDALAAAAAQADTAQSGAAAADGSAAWLRACPLGGPIPDLVAWVRVAADAPSPADPLLLGLAVLLALVLGNAAWIAWTIRDWDHRVASVTTTLAAPDAPALPAVAATGEPGLDRIVGALNRASERLAEARARADTMASRAALSERLAALGRVAAGVAHEIRNPLAAIRLRAENALAGDPTRRGVALEAVLVQAGRLEHLVAQLLAMTQHREPAAEPVDVPGFLADLAAPVGAAVQSGVPRAWFDPAVVRRVLANLLDNARRHAGADGTVRLRAERLGDRLRFSVADSGPGVDAALRQSLFEPFVTGRADGTGLGLAIARELALSHGGRLFLAAPGGDAPGHGAVFVLEVPWRES